jgi:hypothetical protein
MQPTPARGRGRRTHGHVASPGANKNLMLQHKKLLDLLIAGLLLGDDNPRRSQDGADALQESCGRAARAGVLWTHRPLGFVVRIEVVH